MRIFLLIIMTSFAFANLSTYVHRSIQWVGIQLHLTDPNNKKGIIKLPKINTTTTVRQFEIKKEDIKIPLEAEKKYYSSFLDELYVSTLQRFPSKEEKAMYLNLLEQGASREGLYHSIVLSEKYAVLEQLPHQLNLNGRDFVLKFYSEFLQEKFNISHFEKANLYTIKRLTAEKILNAFEHLTRSEVEDWYALFSAETATYFPMLYKSPIRKNQLPLFHKEWARSVPLEHIKSETLIKLHTMFNKFLPQK